MGGSVLDKNKSIKVVKQTTDICSFDSKRCSLMVIPSSVGILLKSDQLHALAKLNDLTSYSALLNGFHLKFDEKQRNS